MTGDIRHLRKLLAAALLAVVLLATSACQSGTTNAGNANPAPAQAADGPASDTRICGTPPCMRFVSRGETKTISDTVSAHPLVSAVAAHAVGLLLCGGILCLLGEGISIAYVGKEAEAAAKNHECLRVRILPSGQEWKLVDIAPSNQSPYCTD